MEQKPNPADFTHNGELQQPHYDNAVRAWEKLERMEQSEVEKAAEEYVNKCYSVHQSDYYTNRKIEGTATPEMISKTEAFKAGAEWANEQKGWVSVIDRPLYTIGRLGWECTEDGDKEFIAAVPYENINKLGQKLWWIRHCIVQDTVGLCVVGDDCNEPAGWELQSVTHWMPLPPPPTI